MTADEILDQAEGLAKRGDAAGAERMLSQQWPDFASAPADAMHLLAMIKGSQNRLAEAEDLLRKAAQKEPNSLRHQIALGHTLTLAGKDSEAVDAYDAALRIDPQWPGLVLVFSQAAYRAGRHAEAERSARHLIDGQPSADTWDALSAALRGQGKGEEALDAANEALRLDGRHASAMNSKGAALLVLGRAQEALEIFDSIAAAGVDAPVLSLNRGAALEMLGRGSEAKSSYDAAASRWPALPNLQQQIAARRSRN
jgi:tetratricopeptide (TPR) repeat protein